MTWDSVPQLDLSAFPVLEAEPVPVRSAKAMDRERSHRRRVTRRRYVRILRAGNAAEAIAPLPEMGESMHAVMGGSYDGFDLVQAVLTLAGPATISRLDIATLGFNRVNMQALFELLDAGKIGQVTFLCSSYFQSVDGKIFTDLEAGLHARGHRCVVCRSHAKLLLFQMSDDRAFVIESSANLRSCKNVEQFTFCQSAELLAFHRGWMDELIAATTIEKPNVSNLDQAKDNASDARPGVRILDREADSTSSDRATALGSDRGGRPR